MRLFFVFTLLALLAHPGIAKLYFPSETQLMQLTLNFFFGALANGNDQKVAMVVMDPFAAELAHKPQLKSFFKANQCQMSKAMKRNNVLTGTCKFPNANYIVQMYESRTTMTGWKISKLQPMTGQSFFG